MGGWPDTGRRPYPASRHVWQQNWTNSFRWQSWPDFTISQKVSSAGPRPERRKGTCQTVGPVRLCQPPRRPARWCAWEGEAEAVGVAARVALTVTPVASGEPGMAKVACGMQELLLSLGDTGDSGGTGWDGQSREDTRLSQGGLRAHMHPLPDSCAGGGLRALWEAGVRGEGTEGAAVVQGTAQRGRGGDGMDGGGGKRVGPSPGPLALRTCSCSGDPETSRDHLASLGLTHNLSG